VHLFFAITFIKRSFSYNFLLRSIMKSKTAAEAATRLPHTIGVDESPVCGIPNFIFEKTVFCIGCFDPPFDDP
jgi:hypothetical protein